METHVSYLRSGRGVLAILAFTGRLCPKGVPFQTLGLWKVRDLTCWNIWKGWEICHCSLWKTQKGWQMEIMAVKKWRKRSGFVLYLYFNDNAFTAVRVIFVWPWKTVSVSVHYFFYQPMDEKIKTWTLSFPPKKTLLQRRYRSIGQSCCSMTSKQSIHCFLESSRAWFFLTRAFA